MLAGSLTPIPQRRPQPRPTRSFPAPLRVPYLLALLLWLSIALGAGPTSRPAAGGNVTSPRGAALTAAAVCGLVQASAGETPEAAWVNVQPGQRFVAGTAFQTGPRSILQLVGDAGQSITVDRLSCLTLLPVAQGAASGSILVELRYGRVRCQCTSAVDSVITLSTPNTHLIVRGSDVIAFDQAPYPPAINSLRAGEARIDLASPSAPANPFRLVMTAFAEAGQPGDPGAPATLGRSDRSGGTTAGPSGWVCEGGVCRPRR